MLTKKEKLRKSLKQIRNKLLIKKKNTIPVFIFGEMRSGTNMLADCLDQCLQTSVYNETDDEVFDGYALKSPATIIQTIERANGSHAVFKSIADSNRAAELISMLDDCRVIWIFRDYRDVVNSAMRKWKEHNRYLKYVLDDAPKARWRSSGLPSQTTEMIRYHYERKISEESARALIWCYRNEMFFQQKLHRCSNVILVRYEDLVTHPDRYLARIFDHVGLDYKQNYRQKVSTASIGKNKPPNLDSEIDAQCRKLLDKLNEKKVTF